MCLKLVSRHVTIFTVDKTDTSTALFFLDGVSTCGISFLGLMKRRYPALDERGLRMAEFRQRQSRMQEHQEYCAGERED